MLRQAQHEDTRIFHFQACRRANYQNTFGNELKFCTQANSTLLEQVVVPARMIRLLVRARQRDVFRVR
jgi:hypothetical protein